MEVGRRCRHVAQARHAQDLGFRRGERVKDAVSLEEVAAEIHTLMTGDSTERLEQLMSVLLLGRQRRGIATEPTVESAPGGQQRPFVGGDRVQ